nr:hypothetical protein [Abalone asfa-like virus]
MSFSRSYNYYTWSRNLAFRDFDEVESFNQYLERHAHKYLAQINNNGTRWYALNCGQSVIFAKTINLYSNLKGNRFWIANPELKEWKYVVSDPMFKKNCAFNVFKCSIPPLLPRSFTSNIDILCDFIFDVIANQDPETNQLILEFLRGLVTNKPIKKILVIISKVPRSGKSTFLRIILPLLHVSKWAIIAPYDLQNQVIKLDQFDFIGVENVSRITLPMVSRLTKLVRSPILEVNNKFMPRHIKTNNMNMVITAFKKIQYLGDAFCPIEISNHRADDERYFDMIYDSINQQTISDFTRYLMA